MQISFLSVKLHYFQSKYTTCLQISVKSLHTISLAALIAIVLS